MCRPCSTCPASPEGAANWHDAKIQSFGHSKIRDTQLGRAARGVRSALRRREAHSASFEGRLVWMLGSPRTGSTWLMQLLAAHDAVVPIDEPLIGWYLSPFISDMPGADATALDSSNFTLRRLQADKPAQFFSERFSHVWVPALGRMLQERLHAHALAHPSATPPSRRVVIIKEPNGSQSADVIMRALPRARLLFLLRDGRDVVDSDLAANLQGSWVSREFPGMRGVPESERLAFIEQSALKWLWRTEMVQEALQAHPGPTYLLRYEDLLREPLVHLRQLFAWVGLPAPEEELATSVERNAFTKLSSGVTGPKEFFRSAAPGAWRQNLTVQEQEVLERTIGHKLRELGYR